MELNIRTYYRRPKTVKSVNTEPSRTTPNQAMSISEIINRTRKGLPVTGVRVPLYNETDDGIMPDLRNMDISEIHDLKTRLRETEERIKRDLRKQELDEQQKKAEEFYRKKFEAEKTTETPVETAKPLDGGGA